MDYFTDMRRIVDAYVPRERLYRPLVIDSTVRRLDVAVKNALDSIEGESPAPSTSKLFDCALGQRPVVRPGVNGADIQHRAVAHLLRGLHKRLLRAFLVAECHERGARLETETRELLREHVWVWLDSHDLYELGRELLLEDDQGEDESSYQPGYRSPRERELDAIVRDKSRSTEDRQDAAMQLAAIEEKRLEDNRKRWDWSSSKINFRWKSAYGGLRKRGTPYKFSPVRSCAKHGTRGCSHCHPRKLRQTPNSEFERLALARGWRPEELKRSLKPGRPSVAEKERYEALVDVVVAVYDMGFTMEAIGRATGRDRKTVSKLIQSRRP